MVLSGLLSILDRFAFAIVDFIEPNLLAFLKMIHVRFSVLP